MKKKIQKPFNVEEAKNGARVERRDGKPVRIICYIDRDINPIAMDVYRGKATIAITYEDGVPVDSVVVFKK